MCAVRVFGGPEAKRNLGSDEASVAGCRILLAFMLLGLAFLRQTPYTALHTELGLVGLGRVFLGLPCGPWMLAPLPQTPQNPKPGRIESFCWWFVIKQQSS